MKNVNIKDQNDIKNIYLLIDSIVGNVEYYPLVSQAFQFQLYLCKYKNVSVTRKMLNLLTFIQ